MDRDRCQSFEPCLRQLRHCWLPPQFELSGRLALVRTLTHDMQYSRIWKNQPQRISMKTLAVEDHTAIIIVK